MNLPVALHPAPPQRDCACAAANLPQLRADLQSAALSPAHAHLYADSAVFVSAGDARRMRLIIEAVDRVAGLPAYARQVLHEAPAIAHLARGSRGAFLGFDFHLGADGPKLIEINSNAGGGFLASAMLRALSLCCPQMRERLAGPASADAVEQSFIDMFLDEWRLERGAEPLRSVAIVDDTPTEQFLHPEFLLARRLFASRGLDAKIVDARDLELCDGRLLHDGMQIDLVYNRLTDFKLAASGHAVLAEALLSGAAVITPHPRAHALFANKANLVLLSDAARLRQMNASAADVARLLDGIPRTRRVEGDAAGWWRERKRWFFKPRDGYGSRGAYRGDKITRAVFSEVMRGGYVAQEVAPPAVHEPPARAAARFKSDVRHYVYAGKTQLVTSRVYQGQTTNFRTPGGGFAPVYVLQRGAVTRVRPRR